MAKLAFFAAVLVALVALTAAEGDRTLHLQCQRQLEESSLDACQQVVDQQLAVQLPFFVPRSSQLTTGVRVQCCQQLRDISRECRAAAVRRIVRRYNQQAVAPPGEGSYYPGEDEEQQGWSHYPREETEQHGGSYYPGETYPQQEQGWEQQQQGQGWYRPSQTYRPQQQEQDWEQQQQEQGWYHPSQTYRPQQQEQGLEQEQGWYRPSQTYRPQQQEQGQGWYRPSQTYRPQQQEQEQGWYRPSQTYRPQQQEQQQQEQGWYHPSQTCRPQHQQQGWYRPSQTFPQQQQQGWYLPSQTFPQQQQQGWYRPSQTFPQQQQQHELGEITQQQEGQGQQSQQTEFGRFSSPPRLGTEQQARLRMQLRVVALARQVAARLPAMCRLESSALSSSQY